MQNLLTLHGKKWLDDKVRSSCAICYYSCYTEFQIVDSYVFLLMEKANLKLANSVYCVSTFYYAKLDNDKGDIANWIKVSYFETGSYVA